MFHFPITPSAFEAIVEELGPARSSLSRLRTAAHAACARHHVRQAFSPRLESDTVLRAILGAARADAPARDRN